VAEFGEGTEGYAFRHEWMFWVFEALPMLIAIVIFCVHHPSAYLGSDGGKRLFSRKDEEGGGSGEGTEELRPVHHDNRSSR
jgi:hypothetical protein